MKVIVYLVLIVGAFLSCTNRSTSKKQANILFIFTDDQTYSALGALGNNEIITPNLDRLVEEGTSFNNAYNMGAWTGAVCTASRSMIISGRSVWNANNHRERWKSGDSAAIAQSWPKLMEAAGYDTYFTGKWHVDVPAQKVFRYVKHVRLGMPKDAWEYLKMQHLFKTKVASGEISPSEIMPLGYNRPLDEDDDSWNPADTTFGGFWEGGKHWSEVLKDDAIEFLEASQDKDNPFFMYLAFNAPHDPRQAPQEFQDMYDLHKISLPESWQPLHPLREAMGSGYDMRDEALAPFPRTEFATKTHIKEYYAMITHLDQQIGLILDKLEETGQKENTFVFFTADHGLAMGRHGLLGKQNLYEHSMKPPFIAVGPSIPKEKQIDAPIYLQDVMASSLEIAGIEKPGYVEFNSVLPLANGTRKQTFYENGIYGAYIQYQRSIRMGDYKLIHLPNVQKTFLFNLVEDPEEMHDLSQDESHQGRVNELMVNLKKLQSQYRDTLEITL